MNKIPEFTDRKQEGAPEASRTSVTAIANARGLRPETARAAGLRRVTAAEASHLLGMRGIPCGGGAFEKMGKGQGIKERTGSLQNRPQEKRGCQ
ncbi:MAG: hypothetical protein C4294_19440 [Nitrospiraceae bacterium]